MKLLQAIQNSLDDAKKDSSAKNIKEVKVRRGLTPLITQLLFNILKTVLLQSKRFVMELPVLQAAPMLIRTYLYLPPGPSALVLDLITILILVLSETAEDTPL